ncbi:MAG: gamma-glutamyltransferase [Chromatiales bacterium]|jgi:gamma-glutamyltranspeptidase/glutathione hydrolase
MITIDRMMKGAVAAGHPKTAEAATLILEAGGNAFDAALAALCAACVVEPVLTSLGGGGFLLARLDSGETRLFDFFVQTPVRKRPIDQIDFHPIIADFGTAQQEFHIGTGSVATPGTVRGLFDIHRQLGTLPMRRLMEPAIGYARDGVMTNALQAYIFSIVAPIYVATEDARRIYGRGTEKNRLCAEGELLCQPELADTLEILAIEGDRLFYEGEIATTLVEQNRLDGGHLTEEDMHGFRTEIRQPLQHTYRGTRIHSNPPPSSGGMLIRFAQHLLSAIETMDAGFGSSDHLLTLARVMEQTNLARSRHGVHEGEWDEALLQQYLNVIRNHPVTARGTTHISVIDTRGNAASLTLSNGEGCGHLLPGTGIMLNNMLGEEDLNPGGFHSWQENVRVSSMMAPSLAIDKNRLIAIGSGGSNRLRTAILQTLCNMIDYGMSVEEAVAAPRIHYERKRISIEPGFSRESVDTLIAAFPDYHLWDEKNLFFGGAHTVLFDGTGFDGAGDPRRGGVFLRAG